MGEDLKYSFVRRLVKPTPGSNTGKFNHLAGWALGWKLKNKFGEDRQDVMKYTAFNSCLIRKLALRKNMYNYRSKGLL